MKIDNKKPRFYLSERYGNGMNLVDPFRRYQRGLTITDLFPVRPDGICACGCGRPLTGKKRRWASADCQNTALHYFFIIKGDVQYIRREVYKRDAGKCSKCGDFDSQWQADHVKPVHQGGGACDLDNIATLCTPCHKGKTVQDSFPPINWSTVLK